MTNETKHTPTPWDHINGVYTQENGYFSMVQTPDGCVAYVFDKEDAAHIVKCVNMHDELVEAISDCLWMIEEKEGTGDENDKKVDAVRLSLAKARGEV